MEKINVIEKLSRFSDYWNPRIVGELNGQQVKLVKFQGIFDWHQHEDEDELFFVLKGNFTMEFRHPPKKVILKENEFIIVPKRTLHRPVSQKEVHVMLFEPASTLNTGNVNSIRTHATLEKI